MSYRAARYVLSLTAAEDRYIGGLIKECRVSGVWLSPASFATAAKLGSPACLAIGIQSPEAMCAFHTKSLEHEQVAGTSLVGYDITGGFAPTASESPRVRIARKSPATNFPTNGRIFVQIAAYRDKDLLPTLRPTLGDLVAKAMDPDRLRFGLCWQRAPEDSLERFSHDTRMRALAILNVKPERVVFVPKLLLLEYLSVYHAIDLCLDLFPYNGHTTSLD